MKKMKNITKWIATLGLVAVLTINSFTATAFAAEIGDSEAAVVMEADPPSGGDSGKAAPREADNPKNSSNEADTGSDAELTAEKLEVETDGDTAMVETGGFSLYTVEFTYDSKQYVLPGDSEVELAQILGTVGLSGEASAVEVSKSSLFSAKKNEGGEWIVTAHKAFSTKEWMKVTIDGVEYEITVTDDPGTENMTWTVLQTLLDQGGTVTLIDDVTAGEGDSALVIPENTTVTLDLNGHTIDRGLSTFDAVEGGNVITVNGNLTLVDNSTSQTGKLTGGNTTGDGGGVYVAKNGTFTMSGGTISGCTATGEYSQGGGVYVAGDTDSRGTFRVSGAPVISGNMTVDSANNVALGYRTTITVFNELTSGAKIYVYAGYKDPVATAGEAYTLKASDMDAFHSDGDGSLVAALDSDGKVKFFTPWGALQAKLTNASEVEGNPTQIKLSGDLTADTPDNALWIPGGTYVTLDLNGYTIDRELTNQANNGNVITVEGHLTISDNSTAHTGTITGGNNTGNGGGVYVGESGEFTMKGGTISGCNVTGNNSKGGGVYVDNNGKFTMEGGTITGCNASENGGGVYVGNNGKFTMEGGTITGCNASENGGGVYVDNNGKFTMSGGTITGCNASENGGVYVGNNGEFTMSGGTITGCKAGWGSGVYVYEGKFTMEDGIISNCNTDNGGYGGGVYVYGGEFTMKGGTITGCKASLNGGGVCVDSNGTFTMEGGTISGCIVNGIGCKGGGVYVANGKFIIKSGTISGCSAGDGGGVYVASDGTFTMDGGTISGCNATGKDSSSGGGVYVNGSFTMKSGTITDCSATGDESNGGGVFVGGTFNMESGTITGCSVIVGGGGVCVEDGTFTMSGAPLIKDNSANNSANNVALNYGTIITVTGALTTGAEIWVNADKGVAFAKKEGSYSITDTDLTKFHSEKDSSLVAAEDSDGSVKFFTPWGALQAKFNNASTVEGSPTQIKLTGNVTASGNETALVIPADRYVTLDLNDHTIDRGLAGQGVDNNGNVITVSGNLTLTDSSSAHTGTITGGNNGQASGGGVSVNGGTFTMDGGTISGCNAALGGGVNVDSGTFTMTGGTITGCNAYNSGGGVCVNGSFTMNGGTFTMTGGTITDCNVTSHGGRGGGVYVEGGGKFTMDGGTIDRCNTAAAGGGVYNHGTFNMSGGTITNCSATDDESNGGGVYIEDRGTFKVSGTPVISGNKKESTSANNVELGSDATITVTSALIPGAEIYVNAGKGDVVATGENYTLQASDADAFHSDRDGSLAAALDSDGTVKFFTPWGALQAKFNNASTVAGSPTQITLTGDVTAGEGDTALVIPAGKYVTLDLNDHTIDRGLSNVGAVAGGNVITVNGNLTLTDSSTDHTGTITGGNIDGVGGGVRVNNDGTFTMSGGTISGCTATGEYSQGGGVYNAGTFTMEGGTIDRCNAQKEDEYGEGGGVYNAGTFTMEGGTIDSCSAAHDGGGVYNVGMFTMKNNGTISGCGAAKGGGVCVNNAGTFTMEGGTIDRCNTAAAGGGVCNYGTFTMEGGTIDRCNTATAGGGVSNDGTFTMEGGTISGCGAAQGGGVHNYGMFTMEGGTISGCSATIDNSLGGGVYNDGTFTMEGGTISGCGARYGGGVYNDGTFTMSDGMYVKKGGTFTMSDGTITNCSANNQGGGVYNDGTFTMSGGTLKDCSATYAGGVKNAGTFNMSGAPVIRDNKKDNSANNVVLDGGKTITVTGELTSGAEIHVNAGLGVPIAEKGGDRTTALTETEAGYFKSDVDSNFLGRLNDAGQVVLKAPLPALTGAANLTYNGTEQTPALTFFGDPAPAMTASTDYTVSYKKVNGSMEIVINGEPKDAGDYKAVVTGTGSYTGTSEASFTIAPKTVTVSSGIAADKTYDRTTAATLYSTEATLFDGICDGDSLTVSGTGSFEDSSAGSGKTVTIVVSSLTLGGTSSGNYVLASYGNQSETTATINKKKLIITDVTAADKEYDGNTSATTNTTDAVVTGLVDGDTVAFTVSGNFADANKGENKTVTLSGWTLTSGGNNYEIDADNSQKTTTAGITVMKVYITGITAENKEYDGNKSAEVSGTAVLKNVKDDNIISDLSVSNITAEFADKNVGDGKAVSITGGTLDSENYTLIPGKTTGLTADITPKQVIITGLSAKDKVYDTTTAATTIGTAVIDGKIGSDDVTVAPGTAAFDNANAGTGKTVTFSGYSLTGQDVGNYSLFAQPASVTADITPKSINNATVTLGTASFIYNGEERSVSVTDVKLGDKSLDSSDYEVSGSLTGTNVDTYTVTVTGLGNYKDTASADWAIEQKEVGLTWSTDPLTFNGSVQAPTATATGTVNNDEIGVTVSGSQVNAGTGYTATASGLTGEKAGNYKLPEAKTANFSIGKAAAQTITDVASSQVYTLTGVSASVAGKMPENAGTLTYNKAGDATTTGSVVVSGFAVDESGAVTAELSGGAAGDTVTLPVTISSTNYADSAVNVMITLTPKEDAELGITGAPTSKTYGDADFKLTGSVKKEGIGTGSWTWTTSDATVFRITSNGAVATVKILKAGSATITARYESDTTVDTKTTDTITVNTKTLTIEAKDQSIYVGGTVPTLSGTDFYTVTGLVGTDELTAQPTLAYQKDGSAATPDGNTAGTYDIVPSGATASENYTISYTNSTLTIREKGTQTISTENVTVTYGDTDKKVNANVTEPATGGGVISYAVKDGSADYIDVDASTGALTIRKIPTDGKAYVVVTAAETMTYKQATKEVTVKINKADAVPATVSANNCTYDGSEKPLATVDESTLVGGEMWYTLGKNATAAPADNLYTTSIPTATEAGTYHVWYKMICDENHVLDKDITGCLTVNILRKSISVKADDKSKSFGTADEKLTATVSGLAAGDSESSISYSLKRENGEDVGTYTITASGNAEQGNYNVSFENGTYTITIAADKDFDIILSQDSYTYDGTEKTPLVTVKSLGKVIPASEYTITYSSNIYAGTAIVTVSDVTGGNYNVSGSKTFAILKADPKYTLPSSLTAVVGQKLSEVKLPDGWAWVNGEQFVGDKGTNKFTANYTPEDTENYNVVSNVELSIVVSEPEQSNSGNGDSGSGYENNSGTGTSTGNGTSTGGSGTASGNGNGGSSSTGSGTTSGTGNGGSSNTGSGTASGTATTSGSGAPTGSESATGSGSGASTGEDTEPEIIKNDDGSESVTTVTTNENGEKVTDTVTTFTDGTTEESTLVEKSNGSKIETVVTKDKDNNVIGEREVTTTKKGTVTVKETTVDSDGNTTVTEGKHKKNGSGSSKSETKDENGNILSTTTEKTTVSKKGKDTVTTTTLTTENADKTTVKTEIVTVTDKRGNSTYTETTNNPDKTKTVVEGKSNADGTGTATTIVTNKKGKVLSKTEETTEISTKGTITVSSTTTNADGTSSSNKISTSKSGKVTKKDTFTDKDGKKTTVKETIKPGKKGSTTVSITRTETIGKGKKKQSSKVSVNVTISKKGIIEGSITVPGADGVAQKKDVKTSLNDLGMEGMDVSEIIEFLLQTLIVKK